MAQLQFSLIGDSNVRRFVTSVNKRACPDIATAQIASCGKLSMLAEALRQVQSDSDIVIVTCITNFLTDATGSSAAGVRVEPVITDFKSKIVEACRANPSRKFLVGPPMFRSRPVWYKEGLPEVLQKFSAVMASDSVPNLLLMPSFPTPEYEADGVHLTPYAGIEYLIHLFDSARSLVALHAADTSDKVSHGSEATRLLEDRMVAVEQCQKLLSKTLEMKTAVDSELACFQENVRNEVFFVISGLGRLPPGLLGREWQDRAKADVQSVIKTLLGKELPIVVVQNVSGRGADAEVRYHVKMECAAHSQEIRSKFGYFFAKGVDRRPESLSTVSISNRLTPATQIRIAIMKLMAKRYTESNPEGKARVISYEARPMLRIVPPQGSSDSRVKNFTYVEAIKKMPTNFSPTEVNPILLRAGSRFAGRLRSIFVVLDDDMKAVRVRSERTPVAVADESAPEPGDEVEDDEEEERAIVQVQSGSGVTRTKRGPATRVENRAKKSS